MRDTLYTGVSSWADFASALAACEPHERGTAFERARPAYTVKTYLSFRENDIDHFKIKKTPGPYRDSTYKLGGNLDFSAVVPVNKRWGFTVSGLSTRTPLRLYSVRPMWVPNVVASTVRRVARAKLLGRVSYTRSIARPEFGNILPSLSLPDPAGTTRTITLPNPNLKPWTANSYSVSVEYYFDDPSAGVISARGYQRDISDFWGVVQIPPTEELLNAYGIDPATYTAAAGYLVSTRLNGGDAKVIGLEFDYRQSLGFLNPWVRGFSVFGNLTMQHLQGSDIADFIGYVQKTINLGFAYNRSRFTARVAVNLRGRERRQAFTGASVEPGTYQYKNPRDYVDVSAEYRLTRHIAHFASARDLFGIYNDFERYGPTTPQYARLLFRERQSAASHIRRRAESAFRPVALVLLPFALDSSTQLTAK